MSIGRGTKPSTNVRKRAAGPIPRANAERLFWVGSGRYLANDEMAPAAHSSHRQMPARGFAASSRLHQIKPATALGSRAARICSTAKTVVEPDLDRRNEPVGVRVQRVPCASVSANVHRRRQGRLGFGTRRCHELAMAGLPLFRLRTPAVSRVSCGRPAWSNASTSALK
jgi:hypothetical protein